MAIKTIQINKFLTIGENKRNLPNGVLHYLENVEVGTDNSVKQVLNVTTTDNDQCILKLIQYNNIVYGLGFDNTTNKDVTLYKYDTNAYVALTNGTVAGGTLRLYSPFLAVKDGYIYFDPGQNYIARYEIATNTMSATWHAHNGGMLGGTLWQNKLWCWGDSDNYIYHIDGSDLVQGILIPTDQTIKDIIPYGDYLAILCTASQTSNDGVSRMYLWDGSDTIFIDIVDIGYGEVSGGDVLDGIIYAGISFKNKKGFRLKAYTGGIFQTVYTYYGKKNEVSDYIYSFIASQLKAYTGYLYFMVVGARPGSSFADVYEATIFRYGRKNADEPYGLSVYKSLEVEPAVGNTVGSVGNDFVIDENDTYALSLNQNSIYAVVYEASYKTRQVKSTASTFTAQPGVIETSIFTGGDSHIQKKLIGVSTQCVPITSGQSITLKYKADAETTWTTFATINTVGSISQETLNVEATGANLPQFKEIAFRAELLGGAELTGILIKYEEQISTI